MATTHVRHSILSLNAIELTQQSAMVPEQMSGRSQSQQSDIPTWSLHVSGGVFGFKAPKTSGERKVYVCQIELSNNNRVLQLLLHIWRSRSYVRPGKIQSY